MSQSLRESVVHNLRLLGQRLLSGSVTESVRQHDAPSGFLERLPVDLQFLVMTYLSPADLCLLGGTCHYWRGMVRDPLLWRFLLLRDIPFWKSIDHLSMPQLELLNAPLVDTEESLEEREEGVDNNSKVDYMSEYLRGSPSCRHLLPTSARYKVVTSFLQSLVTSAEPRYVMFGPGMEQLEVSFVTKMINCPDLPVSMAGTSHRKIRGAAGIGSGITYLFDNQHKFNILTLYSTNRAERERARTEQQDVNSKLFTVEVNAGSEVPAFSPAPHVQQVCQAVDGFIYVANAELGFHSNQPGAPQTPSISSTIGRENEPAQVRALLSSTWGSTSRPLLVLSCVSREDSPTPHRVPCIHMAKRLELAALENPWMVQDVAADSLSGLLDGLAWILRCSGVTLRDR